MRAQRLLIVDDDLAYQTYAPVLRQAGYETETAQTGCQGLEHLWRHRYDLLLVEFLLGDMTAIDLLKETRAAGIDTPVVVVTGLASVETAVQAMRSGAVHYAVKPLSSDGLVRVIELGMSFGMSSGVGVRGSRAHAAERLAKAIVAVLSLHSDPRTIGHWARAAGVSDSSLRLLCRCAGVHSRRALIFARMLRAVYHSHSSAWRPTQRLQVTDSRTLTKMLSAAGLPMEAERVTLRQFLESQTLIHDRDVLGALNGTLTAQEWGRQLQHPCRTSSRPDLLDATVRETAV